MRRVLFLVSCFIISISTTMAQQTPIKRVVLLIIDGIHWQAPDRLDMPVFNDLATQGTYIQRSYVIIPHHPTSGEYSRYNSCSFPNPVMQEGTLFLSPDNKMIQNLFWPQQRTAFVVNTPTAYRTIGKGFSTLIMDGLLTDDQVIDKSIGILKEEDPAFMRIHLQTPGSEGYNVAQTTPDVPYYRDIYGKQSPYVEALENADKLLGKFVKYLKDSKKWDETLLIVTSDHGQSLIGWHPLFDEESWITPTIFLGPGIVKGRKLNYFEHTDIGPTIAGLIGKTLNTDGGAGRFVKEVQENTDISDYKPKEYVRLFNEQIREYNMLRARMIIASEKDGYYANVVALLENETFIEPFYTQDRVMEWHKAGTMDKLLEANEKVLKRMREVLKAGEK